MRILTEDGYNVTQKGCLRLVGEKVDAIDFYTSKFNQMTEEV